MSENYFSAPSSDLVEQQNNVDYIEKELVLPNSSSLLVSHNYTYI